MILGFGPHRRVESAAELFRRQHSLWLTRAFASPRDYPRIPVKAVTVGGWARLMQRPNGPALAERWWAHAFDRVDDVDLDD